MLIKQSSRVKFLLKRNLTLPVRLQILHGCESPKRNLILLCSAVISTTDASTLNRERPMLQSKNRTLRKELLWTGWVESLHKRQKTTRINLDSLSKAKLSSDCRHPSVQLVNQLLKQNQISRIKDYSSNEPRWCQDKEECLVFIFDNKSKQEHACTLHVIMFAVHWIDLAIMLSTRNITFLYFSVDFRLQKVCMEADWNINILLPSESRSMLQHPSVTIWVTASNNLQKQEQDEFWQW